MECLIGSLTGAYASTDKDMPVLGSRYKDPANGKEYVFAAVVAAGTTITAYDIAYLSDADPADSVMTLCPAALNEQRPIGVRVAGAADLAAGYRGWFQIKGPAQVKSDSTLGTNIAAGGPVTSGDTTAGRVEGSTNYDDRDFAVSREACAVADTVVNVILKGKGW